MKLQQHMAERMVGQLRSAISQTAHLCNLSRLCFAATAHVHTGAVSCFVGSSSAHLAAKTSLTYLLRHHLLLLLLLPGAEPVSAQDRQPGLL
jgi:adenylosuccinate lyase